MAQEIEGVEVGSKVGQMDEHTLAVMDACIGLHEVSCSEDIEKVFENLQQRIGEEMRTVDKIVLFCQSLMATEVSEKIYRETRKLFLAAMLNYRRGEK